MKHLEQDELILHYFGEESARQKSASEAHLRECRECQADFTALETTLKMVEAAQPSVPERGDDYGAEVWNRIRAHLPEHRAGREATRWSWITQPRRWAAVAAMAAVVIVAFLAGRLSKPPQQPTTITATQTSGPEQKARDRVMLVAIGDHLERSQMVLMELVNASANGNGDISSEQQRAEDLLSENRLYRQTAQRAGDKQIADVLDQLERVLVEISNEPSKANGGDLQDLQRRIEARGVLFKVRVLGANIRGQQKPEQQRRGTTERNQQI